MKLPAKETKGIFTVRRRGLEADPATPVLIMVSGFPDSVSTWNPLLPYIEPHFHVVPMAYPGIDPDDVPRLEAECYWGYSLDEVAAALLTVIQEYRNAGCTRIFLLGHDWGAYPVMKIAHEHPTAVTAVVSEDIGLNPFLCLTSIVVILFYQLPLIAIFLVSRMAPYSVGSVCRSAFQRVPWNWFGCFQMPMRAVALHAPYQMHPYFNLYVEMVRKRHVYPVRFTNAPLMYLHGGRKPVMCHSESYLHKLEQQLDCRHILYEDAGHWLHKTHPERMANDMMQFFKQINGCTRQRNIQGK